MSEPSSSSDSSSGLKRLLYVFGGILIVIFLLVAGGIYFATSLLRQVSVQKSGNSVSVQTPIGDLQVDKNVTANTGMPNYPGAVPDDKNQNVKLDFGDEGGFEVRSAVLHSSDGQSLVEDWYAHHLPPEFVHHAAGEQIKLDKFGHANIEANQAAFVCEKKDFVRFVALEPSGSGTTIKLVSIGSHEAQ